MKQSPSPSVGQSLESFLDSTGEREEVYGSAIKRVLAIDLEAARREMRVSKSEMAATLGTSRTQVNRILDPDHVAVSLDTLDRVAKLLGKRLKVELVDA